MARDRSERLWIGSTAGLALLVLLIGWFFLISPQRDETADVDGQVLNAQLQNDTLQARIAKLGGEKQAIAKYSADLQRAQQALPASNDMSAFLRSIQKIAGASGAKVTSLTVAAATAPSGAAVAPAPAATGDPSATAAPAPPTVLAIPITASVTGSPGALNRFLVQLQSVQPRAVLVTAITQTDQKGSAATLQLSMQAFVAPTAAGTAPAVAGAPVSASSSPSPSSSPSTGGG